MVEGCRHEQAMVVRPVWSASASGTGAFALSGSGRRHEPCDTRVASLCSEPHAPKSPISVIPAKAGIHPRHGAPSQPGSSPTRRPSILGGESRMLRCLQLSLLALVIAACAPGAATNGEPIPANPLPFDTGTGPGIVDPDAPLITYTSVDGFVPKRLDVEPGTQVRFYNASSETFWPRVKHPPDTRNSPGA